jgi:hypothetical protein
MSYADYGMSTIQVKIFLSLIVPNLATLAVIDGNVEEGINIE